MLFNLELRSSTKATTVAVAEITGDGGWKKSVFASFFGDQKIESSGHPIAGHILTTGLHKCL